MKIQALERGLAIARYAAESANGLTLTELAHLTGLNKTTVYHLAQTLVAEGLLDKDARALYRIGPLPAALMNDARRNSRESLVRETLIPVHRLYPEASLIVAELGDAELFSRYMLQEGKPGSFVRSDDMTLNPYLTVAGVLFFAFLPEERLRGLRLHHPFDYKGKETWGSEAAFNACVMRARDRGWSDTAEIVPKELFKIGIPVFDPQQNLIATITFNCHKRYASSPAKIRRDLMAAASIIGGTAPHENKSTKI
ncbi:MAG: helix-turn-helix domain-containing protein [Spirochaetes bacterium]|nr:helix-turn-helix domain-containing protein [Spirochaetota bacterium]